MLRQAYQFKYKNVFKLDDHGTKTDLTVLFTVITAYRYLINISSIYSSSPSHCMAHAWKKKKQNQTEWTFKEVSSKSEYSLILVLYKNCFEKLKYFPSSMEIITITVFRTWTQSLIVTLVNMELLKFSFFFFY